MKKIIVILFIFIFSSCISQNEKILKPPDSSENCIVFNDEAIYSVVRSDTSSKDVTNAAVHLRKYIQGNINCDIKILTDWVKNPEDIETVRNEYEILVGLTNRPESIEAYERFKSSHEPLEYMIEKIGNCYVIVGNDLMIMDAVQQFIENITIYNEGAILKITDDIDIKMRKPFPVGRMTVDGINIKEFQIVYPDAYKESEKDIVYNIQEYIYLATGDRLDIISDKEKKSDHEIIIGTARDKSYANHNDQDCIIEIRGGNLYLGGNNYDADVKAANYLMSDFFYYDMHGVKPREIKLISSDSKYYESKPNS